MKREIKHPEKLVSTRSYSAAVECDDWLFVSGHAAQTLATGEVVVHGTIAEETRLTLSHSGTLLAQPGCTFGDVVKCTCHLADITDFEEFDKTYREFFTGVKPARTTVQSVLGERIKVEIDAIARVPRGDRRLWHQGVW
jgi:2-iminobutanoate/2-iminopropanoate deaminase